MFFFQRGSHKYTLFFEIHSSRYVDRNLQESENYNTIRIKRKQILCNLTFYLKM